MARHRRARPLASRRPNALEPRHCGFIRVGGTRDGRWSSRLTGLAAGRGVIIADDRQSRRSGHRRRHEGSASSARQVGKLVIEECLSGPEVSFFVVSDGRAGPVRCSRRRITSASSTMIRGPNTGGMGAFAPSPLVDLPRSSGRIMRDIVEPVIAGMAKEGHPFLGFLFVGLMLTSVGPKGNRVQCTSR